MRSDDFRYLVYALLVSAIFGAALGVSDQFFILLTALAGCVTAFVTTRRKDDE